MFLGRDGTPLSSPADITGPIILQTYRAIADYEKSSKSEMALKAGDMVDIVEKSESGKCPCPEGQPRPGHHLGRAGISLHTSCPNPAPHSIPGAFLTEGLEAGSRSPDGEQKFSTKPRSPPCPAGARFTFTWSHMMVCLGQGVRQS